jgi:hypothetical protein
MVHNQGPSMKNLFTGFLVINLLLEGLAGAALIGGTLELFTIEQLETGMWAMVYGFAALAIASAIFWVWSHRARSEAVGPVLGILLAFHALVAVAFALQGNQVPVVIVHAVMAALAIFLYSQRTTWCEE